MILLAINNICMKFNLSAIWQINYSHYQLCIPYYETTLKKMIIILPRSSYILYLLGTNFK